MKPFRKRLLAGLGAAALASTIGIAAPTAAHAAASECPEHRYCFFFNSDFKGARADMYYPDASLAQELFNDGPAGRNGWLVRVGNNAASVVNNFSNRTIHLYENNNCTGLHAKVPPGGRLNLAAVGLKNRVSSVNLQYHVTTGSWFDQCTLRNQSGI